jgi:inner membrane protein COX18
MTKKFNELIKERKCDPKWTIAISALVQAPPYIAFSMILSRAAADPLTPFRSESFLTLTSLAHPDPTMTLPIVLGIISMANVDTKSWWMTAAEQDREKKFHQWKAEKAERKGKPYVQSPLKSVLRGLSIARIGLAMLVPGVRCLSPTFHSLKFDPCHREFNYTGSRRPGLDWYKPSSLTLSIADGENDWPRMRL